MGIIRIIKPNKLNIPVGTQLHFDSFFDKVKNDNSKCWDSVGVYCWQDLLGKVHIIKYSEIYPEHKDCYVNVIVLQNLKFAIEKETYWKVFCQKQEAKFHKLENGGKSEAICFKPYKDVVQSNTNSMCPAGVQRFQTEAEALTYISSVSSEYKNMEL